MHPTLWHHFLALQLTFSSMSNAKNHPTVPGPSIPLSNHFISVPQPFQVLYSFLTQFISSLHKTLRFWPPLIVFRIQLAKLLLNPTLDLLYAYTWQLTVARKTKQNTNKKSRLIVLPLKCDYGLQVSSYDCQTYLYNPNPFPHSP